MINCGFKDLFKFVMKYFSNDIYFFYIPFTGQGSGGEVHMPLAVSHGQSVRGQVSYWRHQSSYLCAGELFLNPKWHLPLINPGLWDLNLQILRSHVMVRVGGGWDTLSHYLDKHDPCRCRAQHRSSVAARLVPRQSPNHNPSNGIELHKAQVIFERWVLFLDILGSTIFQSLNL